MQKVLVLVWLLNLWYLIVLNSSTVVFILQKFNSVDKVLTRKNQIVDMLNVLALYLAVDGLDVV